MNPFRRILLLLLAATLLGPAVAGAQAKKGKTASFTILEYSAPIPSAWESQPPASSYRKAQYRVPGDKKLGDGEMVVFYFGQGQGGTIDANVARWVSQFSTPDGKPVEPKMKKLTSNGIPVTIVELTGSYSRGVGMGPQGSANPDQTLLVAIFETPHGNVTIQLHGHKSLIAANRAAFDAMVKGFHRGIG